MIILYNNSLDSRKHSAFTTLSISGWLKFLLSQFEKCPPSKQWVEPYLIILFSFTWHFDGCYVKMSNPVSYLKSFKHHFFHICINSVKRRMCIVYYKIDHRKRSGKLIKYLTRAREMFGWYVQKSRSFFALFNELCKRINWNHLLWFLSHIGLRWYDREVERGGERWREKEREMVRHWEPVILWYFMFYINAID